MRVDTSTASVSASAADKLSGVALELAYVQSRRLAHVQCAPEVFVMFDTESEQLTIFGALEKREVTTGSFHGNLAGDVLCDAQQLGARLEMRGTRCCCSIGAVQREGATFIEAALRALVAYRKWESKSRPEQQIG